MRLWVAAALVFASACGRGRGGEPARSGEAEGAAQSPRDTTAVAPRAADTVPAPPRPLARGDTVVEGIVAVVGADPLTQVIVQSGAAPDVRAVAVRGPLRDEIAALSGATLRVWGRPVPGQPPPPARAVQASGYEIRAIGGRRPLVGILRAAGDVWLDADRPYRLVRVPDALAEMNGAKVWIVGALGGDTLAVETFGVIRR